MASETLLPSFDYMFALRISYTDILNDEHDIIKKLKNYLLELEPNDDIIDKYLTDFYKEYNIEIDTSILDTYDNYDYEYEYKLDSPSSLDNIQESDLMNIFMETLNINNNYNTLIVDNNVIPNPLLNIFNPPLIYNNVPQTYNTEILMNIINNILNEDDNEYKDVVTTLDEEDFSKIKSYKQEEDSESSCIICCDNFVKDIDVSCLPCQHKYHTECITTYLKEYNYICPICRAEVGKSKAHI